jgi:hypothetical protein
MLSLNMRGKHILNNTYSNYNTIKEDDAGPENRALNSDITIG